MKTHPLLLSLVLTAGSAHAGELIYQPINPSFGGDPLNGSYLLNKAQAQNDTKDPDAVDYGSYTETDLFIQDLRTSLTNNLIEDALNSGGGGVVDSSELKVTVTPVGAGFKLQILNKRTGEVTDVNFNDPAQAIN